MKGCELSVDVISERDIDWFYKINPTGLAIKEDELNKIIKDRNMPDDVKNMIKETFPHVTKRRFWFA